MKLIQQLGCSAIYLKTVCLNAVFFRIVFLGAALITQSAFANLQFTYTSQELPFRQGYLGGDADDTIGSNEPPYPSFSVSFANTENNVINTLVSGDLLINLAPGFSTLLNNVPATDSSITLNDDGSLAAWHFELAFTQTTPETPTDSPGRNGWFVESSHGVNTCNCDWFKYDFDIYTPRAYDQWAYVNTVGLLYGDANTSDNWTITKVEVPEPPSPLLFLAGIAIIGLVRLRNKAAL